MEFLLRHKNKRMQDGSTLFLGDETITADYFHTGDSFVKFYSEKEGVTELIGIINSDVVYSISVVDNEYMDKIIKADIGNVCDHIRGDGNAS